VSLVLLTAAPVQVKGMLFWLMGDLTDSGSPIAAVATVAAVMLAGGVGFVGLMVPHAVRRLGVTAYRWLLPLSVLLGGAFLTLADTVARTLVAPAQLPVGVLTAMIGVPLMLWLLRGRRLN